jgi:hypothetical protein
MSLFNSLDRTKHLSEFTEALQTSDGWLTSAQRVAKVLANLGLTNALIGVSNVFTFPTDATVAFDGDSELDLTNAAVIGGSVVVPDAATYTVLGTDSGKLHVIPGLTASCTLALPSDVTGDYTFVGSGVAADAQNWVFDAGADTAFFLGGITHLDTNAGTGAAEIAVVYPDGNSNSILTVNVPHASSKITFHGDGTNWLIVDSRAVSDTAPAFADQS